MTRQMSHADAGALVLVMALVTALTTLAALAPPAARPGPSGDVDWPFYGNDLANTSFQDVDQIAPSNVARLRPAWIFHTGVHDQRASLEVSPIEVGGTVYVTDGHDDVFALDAATGAREWVYKP